VKSKKKIGKGENVDKDLKNEKNGVKMKNK